MPTFPLFSSSSTCTPALLAHDAEPRCALVDPIAFSPRSRPPSESSPMLTSWQSSSQQNPGARQSRSLREARDDQRRACSQTSQAAVAGLRAPAGLYWELVLCDLPFCFLFFHSCYVLQYPMHITAEDTGVEGGWVDSPIRAFGGIAWVVRWLASLGSDPGAMGRLI